jgi:hypothetical protein
MADTLLKTLTGDYGNVGADSDDIKHMVKREFVFHFGGSGIAADVSMLVYPISADIVLTGAYLVAGIPLTLSESVEAVYTIGRAPQVATTVAYTVTAFDSLETNAAGTGTTILGERTDFTIVESTDTITAGQMLCCTLTKTSTGSITNGTVVVEYRLAN